MTYPMTYPMTDPMADLMTDPMTDSVTDPMTDPVTDCMTDSTTDPMTDPIYNKNYNVRAVLHPYDVFNRMLSRLAACLASVRKTSRCVTGTSTCSRYLSQCNFFTFPNVTFFLHKPKTSVFMLCLKFYQSPSNYPFLKVHLCFQVGGV